MGNWYRDLLQKPVIIITINVPVVLFPLPPSTTIPVANGRGGP
jgi:hypothetical protein